MKFQAIQTTAIAALTFASIGLGSVHANSTQPFAENAPAIRLATAHYQSAEVSSQPKVLVVMTNHSEYPTRDDSTGLWLTELTHFYQVFHDAGIEMDFVSPKGGKVPLDERSLGWIYSDEAAHNLLKTSDFSAKLDNTLAAADVKAEGYDVIFYTGGHGTMWDFRGNADLKRLGEGIYQNGGIVSSVCHGAAGLLDLQNADGTALIANKKVTGFSNFEELLSGVKSQVPFYLQSEMEEDGAAYSKALLPFTSYVVTDGRLVTGQNPNSSKEVAQEVLAALRQNLKLSQGQRTRHTKN